MTSAYTDQLAARAARAAVPDASGGASSYFSRPTADYDPSLIEHGDVRGDVRRWVVGTLYAYWGKHFRDPQKWSTVWIAGSALTKQWSAARSIGEPGDLDVLIGVDFTTFFQWNPAYRGMPQPDMAARFNEDFHLDLSPVTARQVLGQSTYEVTWYVNPNSEDIRDIHPYAAFNCSDNEWTVRPPEIPDDWDPHTAYGTGWWAAVNDETEQAHALLRRYRETRQRMLPLGPGTPGHLNAVTELHEAVRAGASLFKSIHSDRKKAFGPGGNGYRDYYNFRWQVGKETGIVPALHQLADLDRAAHADVAATCYNGQILDPGHALALAALTVGGSR